MDISTPADTFNLFLLSIMNLEPAILAPFAGFEDFRMPRNFTFYLFVRRKSKK